LEKEPSDLLPKIISYAFHPLLMPTYALALYFWVDSTASYFMKFEIKRALFAMTFCFTFLLPVFNSLILLKAKYLKSLRMDTKEERRIPLLATAIFFVAEYYILSKSAVPQTLKLLILSATLSVVLTLIINVFWKISAHMIGIGGVVGAMFALSYITHFKNAEWLMIVLILVAGIIGMARLQLKAHSPAEILVGFIVGAMCPFLVWYLYPSFL
jgi:membrane-associated phospholipid phosphatase